jgi:hypothetical protein
MEEISNLEKLTAAGMFEKTPLPDRYEDVIERLTPGEVDALVSVKKSFEDAGIYPEDTEFTEYIHWF